MDVFWNDPFSTYLVYKHTVASLHDYDPMVSSFLIRQLSTSLKRIRQDDLGTDAHTRLAKVDTKLRWASIQHNVAVVRRREYLYDTR